MSSVKFTNATLEKFLSAPNPEGKRRTIWDSEARGLGAYQTKNGVCTLFAHYRLANGVQRKQVLGRFKEIPLDEARHLAQKYRVAAKQGIDLAGEQKWKEPSKQGLTIEQAYKEFTEAQHRRENSPNTIRLNGYNWRNHLSQYQDREMASVSKHDVRAWHKEWGKSGPTVANQTARLFRAIYNYAVKFHDDLPPNPCSAVDYFKEVNNRRLIATKDLPAWRKKVDGLPNPIRRCYWRFLALTGLRRMDAASVRWDEVFETHIHRPNPKGGKDKAFDVPITAPLRALLEEAKAAQKVLYPASPYVFPADSKSGHISTGQEQKFMPGCAPHDLRRTYATACVEVGVDPYTIKLLNRSGFAGGSNLQIGWSHDEQNDEQVFTRSPRP
ncbi:MAG: integrase family protein, partial [Proteobacteria bacterium]|nr:integrase family protein [Pseudomonadota bacterium]